MNTSSIKERLELMYGFKDIYNLEELNQIESLTINRFDIDNEILMVDFNDLKFFNNLKELIINDCIITNKEIEIISNLKQLSNLLLLNCDIVEDIKENLLKLKLQNLVLDNVNINLDILSEIYLKKITFKNIDINKELFIVSHEIDIKNCNIEDINYLKIDNYNKVTISIFQYKKYKNFFDHYKEKLVIFEENGQFKVGE